MSSVFGLYLSPQIVRVIMSHFKCAFILNTLAVTMHDVDNNGETLHLLVNTCLRRSTIMVGDCNLIVRKKRCIDYPLLKTEFMSSEITKTKKIDRAIQNGSSWILGDQTVLSLSRFMGLHIVNLMGLVLAYSLHHVI